MAYPIHFQRSSVKVWFNMQKTELQELPSFV